MLKLMAFDPSLNTQSCCRGLLVVRNFCFWAIWAAGPVLKFIFTTFYVGKFKCVSRIFVAPLCTGNCSILGNVHRLDSALDIDEASIWLFWRPPLRRLATLWFVRGTLYFNYVQTYRATFLLKG